MNKKQHTLFLINPRQKYVNYYAQTELSRNLGKKKFMIPLAIPTLAALTPSNYNIRIIDEEIESIPSELPDIVGITTLAATILRVYEIADWYRSKGVTVILGGAYSSYMVEEGLEHADAIVAGEAELLWEECLKDFENKSLKKVYSSDKFCKYEFNKPPRWDLIKKNMFFQVGVQVSRGCPYKCEFCLVHELFGRKMRYRNLDNVIEELQSLPVKKVFFIDDNLTVNREYVRELMTRIKPLKIAWSCMASIDIANDTDLLKMMAEAGCFNILIGFESLNKDSLNETKKQHNRAGLIYKEAVDKIHKAGIHITASFAVGFDNDTLEEFDKIVEFTNECGLSYINLNILGAPPGSNLYKRLNNEGRWYGISPEYRSGLFPCFHYNNMSQTELFDKYFETIDKIYSYKTIYKKSIILFEKGNFDKPYLDGKIPVKFIFKILFLIFKNYTFSINPYKRKMFFKLLGYVLKRKAAIDKISSYLISMMSYNNHISKMMKNKEEYRNIVKQNDKGAWKNILH